MAKCLELMIITSMTNHMYLFKNTIRLQTKGGAIGLKVTQALARLYMLWWDKKFLDTASKAGFKIKMYKRYVDNTNIIMKALEPNVVLDEESQQLKSTNATSQEEDPTDVRSAKVIKKIANRVAECIQWEEAIPSSSHGGRLPILDLQCWYSDTYRNSTIFYTFCRKPMANQQLMLFNSAMPKHMKRTTLSQEVIRIVRNCHPDLP